MSTAGRLISGSVASWVQLSLTMASHIVLVPIYLNHWSVETYGIWLAVQGIMSVLSMLDLGHQNFMQFEFLRLGKDLPTLSKSLWSAIIIALSISAFQVLLIGIFLLTDILPVLLGDKGIGDPTLTFAAGMALLLQGILWLLAVTVPGLMTRVLAPFGYFPRMAWWGVVYAVTNILTPLTAVVMGGDLLMAAIAQTLGSLAIAIFLYLDLFKLLKRERIRFIKPSVQIGFSNFRKSLPLLGKSLFENFRQQGVRLILAPLAGPVGLAAFSTMRTGANVALQGLNTIINPLVPDLMRFLHDRDQARSEAAFATIWIVVVALMAPGVVFLQAFVEPFYVFWTQGKIEFNPLLFALLSLGVLVYAVIQPAIAVVVGNNLTKIQLNLTALSAIIVLGVLCVLVPWIGILGAAIALLIGEIVAAFGYKMYAKRWLRENELLWPRRAFRIAVLSVSIAAVALGALILFPEYTWLILIVSMTLLGWNILRFWKQLPDIVNQSAIRILRRIPGVTALIGWLKRFKWLKRYKAFARIILRYPKKIEGYR